MRHYLPVAALSPAFGDEYDPVAAWRAREHARIRELREVVRRDGPRIDEEEKGVVGRAKELGWGWSMRVIRVPRKDKHPPAGEHARGKDVPAAYHPLQDQGRADEREGGEEDDDTAQPALLHVARDLGFIVAQVALLDPASRPMTQTRNWRIRLSTLIRRSQSTKTPHHVPPPKNLHRSSHLGQSRR